MENKTVTPEAIQFKAKVKDWGLSHTTLEEVFMKVRKTVNNILFLLDHKWIETLRKKTEEYILFRNAFFYF